MTCKSAAAAAAFLLALVVSLGCPRDEKVAEAPNAAPAKHEAMPADVPQQGTTEPKVAEPAKPIESSKPVERTPAPTAPSVGDGAPRASDNPHSDNAAPTDALFKDWPKSLTVLVATGMQMGYIEPCGCSGKENQKGGLSRRDNFLKKLRADGWDVVPLDVGGQIRRFGKQAELKFQATADALKTMKYAAVAFGADDLRLPVEALTAAAADVDKNSGPFVGANVALFDFDQGVTPRFRIISAGKLKLGVTAVLGDSFQKSLTSGDLKFKPAADALKEVLPQLKAAHCDHLVLLAHAELEETKALAKQFPDFDLVITSGGAAEPPREPQTIDGTNTPLIEVGQKGMYANVIGLTGDPQRPFLFQKVPLTAQWGEAEEMHRAMAAYQDQLKELGLDGLGLKPAAYPSAEKGSFVGSDKCGECHTKAYAIWKKTPHAHALATLEKLKPARQYDPECLSCHVTGWEPQKFYPYVGGYLSREKTPTLADNGCENCHGPGSAHVAAESGDAKLSDKQIAALRIAMQVPHDRIENSCTACHDGDNSLNFKFETYWPKVEHHGKD